MEPPDFVSPSLLRPLPSQLGTGWHLGDRGLLLPEGASPYPKLAHAWPDMPGGQAAKKPTLRTSLQPAE